MDKKELLVKDIINNVHAYDPLADKLFNKLNLIIESIESPTLLIINFSELITLTYEFIEKALEPVIKANYSKEIIVLYKVSNKSELEEIITGVVDFLNLQSNNKEQLNEKELLSLHYSLVYLDNEDNVNYVGNISTIEGFILKIIEEGGSLTHIDIDTILKSKKKAEYCEEITNSVSKLRDLGFINLISKGDGIPSSIYQSIKYLIENGN